MQYLKHLKTMNLYCKLNAAIRQLANINFIALTNTNYYDIAWWKILSQGKMDKKTRLGQKKFNKVGLKSYAKFKIFKKWQKYFISLFYGKFKHLIMMTYFITLSIADSYVINWQRILAQSKRDKNTIVRNIYKMLDKSLMKYLKQ